MDFLPVAGVVGLREWSHIVWDWNGTLLNDAWLCVEVVNGILRDYGLPAVMIENYRERFGFPVINYYRSLGFQGGEEVFQAVSERFVSDYNARRHECAIHAGARELLEDLKAEGKSHTILSANRQDWLEETLAQFDLREFFGGVSGLDNIYAGGKVERGRIHFETEALEPGKTLLVGDTLHDFEVAQALGCSCVLMAHGHQSEERLRQSKTPVYQNFDELRQAFL